MGWIRNIEIFADFQYYSWLCRLLMGWVRKSLKMCWFNIGIVLYTAAIHAKVRTRCKGSKLHRFTYMDWTKTVFFSDTKYRQNIYGRLRGFNVFWQCFTCINMYQYHWTNSFETIRLCETTQLALFTPCVHFSTPAWCHILSKAISICRSLHKYWVQFQNSLLKYEGYDNQNGI